MKPTIAISIGDYNGIGPEVALKTVAELSLAESTPLLLSNSNIVEFYKEACGLNFPTHVTREIEEIKPGVVNILDCIPDTIVNIVPGKLTANSGKAAMVSVQCGVDLCLDKKADALVTAPISKEAIKLGGYSVPGHTEFLAGKTSTRNYMMILAGGGLRVGLATIHEPLKLVPGLINKKDLVLHLQTFSRSLIKDFGVKNPKIAVFGLNPHAGDGGVIGSEEIDIIAPAIQAAKEQNLNVEGPFAADGFFGNRMQDQFDGILAMYHDQGLVPFKALTFGEGVNVTAGLPIVRTSPDHGTAFDIAGKNRANHHSFSEAYNMALQIVSNRNRGDQKS